MPAADVNSARRKAARSRWRVALGTVILLIFVVLVQWFVGWGQLLAPWRSLPPGPLVVALLLVLVSYFLRALRLHDYFRAEAHGRIALAFRLMLQHNLMNNLLPMRTGELSFPVLMARYFAVPARRSLPALLWFRVLDLHTLGLLALLAFAALSAPRLGLALALVWLSLPWWLYRLNAWGLSRLRGAAPGRWRDLALRVLAALPVSTAAFWRAWVWTVANWAVKLSVFAWVLSRFADIVLPVALFGVIAGELTSVLPVHGVAGAGTYEAGIIAGLVPLGVGTEDAVRAAVNLHLFLLGASLLGGAISPALGKRQAIG